MPGRGPEKYNPRESPAWEGYELGPGYIPWEGVAHDAILRLIDKCGRQKLQVEKMG